MKVPFVTNLITAGTPRLRNRRDSEHLVVNRIGRKWKIRNELKKNEFSKLRRRDQRRMRHSPMRPPIVPITDVNDSQQFVRKIGHAVTSKIGHAVTSKIGHAVTSKILMTFWSRFN
jgi:hypothetical protein